MKLKSIYSELNKTLWIIKAFYLSDQRFWVHVELNQSSTRNALRNSLAGWLIGARVVRCAT